MSAVGIELLLSTICINATYCPIVYDNPLHDVEETKKQRALKLLADELNGKHLRIGTVESYPHSWVERRQDGKLVGRGVAFVLVEILQQRFNFTFEVVTPPKNWEGGPSKLETSLLGLVNGSKVDMAATFLPMMPDSQKVAKYSVYLDEGTWVMMMKRPAESAAGSGLLAPFEQYVWWVRTDVSPRTSAFTPLETASSASAPTSTESASDPASTRYLILVAVISYGPCITFLTHLRHRFTGQRGDKPINLSPSMWFVYGAFIKQGTTLAPDANSTRVLFATWWLFIILLSSFYTANLTAFLTLSKFTLDIEDPEDLYKKNYRWTAAEGGAVEYVVTDPDENLFYLNKMVQVGRGFFRVVNKNSDFLSDVSSGIVTKFQACLYIGMHLCVVLVQDKVSVDHVMYDDYLTKVRQGIEEKDRCTYVVTTKLFMTKMRAFAYPHNTTYKILFDEVLQAMVESGIIKHLMQRDLPSTKICPLDLQSKERRLRNSDLMMTYVLAMVGLATATAVFIGEMFIRRFYSIKITTNKTMKWQEEFKTHHTFWDNSRPPPYDSLFGFNSQYKQSEPGKTQMINGRDYWVVKTISGDSRLIPVRTPSAFLFQPS